MLFKIIDDSTICVPGHRTKITIRLTSEFTVTHPSLLIVTHTSNANVEPGVQKGAFVIVTKVSTSFVAEKDPLPGTQTLLNQKEKLKMHIHINNGRIVVEKWTLSSEVTSISNSNNQIHIKKTNETQ